MDPETAVQLLLALAKISGTILAILMAIIVFSIRDEDLARLILLGKPHGYWPLVTLSISCLLFALEIVFPLSAVFYLNLGEPVSDSKVLGLFIPFVASFVALFVFFGALLSEKRDFLKGQDKTARAK